MKKIYELVDNCGEIIGVYEQRVLADTMQDFYKMYNVNTTIVEIPLVDSWHGLFNDQDIVDVIDMVVRNAKCDNFKMKGLQNYELEFSKLQNFMDMQHYVKYVLDCYDLEDVKLEQAELGNTITFFIDIPSNDKMLTIDCILKNWCK